MWLWRNEERYVGKSTAYLKRLTLGADDSEVNQNKISSEILDWPVEVLTLW